MAGTDDNSVAYARRLYDEILGWYQSADTKAQVILGLDAIFVTVLAGSFFAEPAKLKAITASIPPIAWLLLLDMTVCLLASVVSAVYCLWSRMYSRSHLAEVIESLEHDNADAPRYSPRVLWFFQHIAVLDGDRLLRSLAAVDESFEIQAMATQIHILAQNVRRKHLAVDFGFVLTGATLALFFFASVVYVLYNTA